MFTLEELSIIAMYLDARQSRSGVINAMEAAFPAIDTPEIRETVSYILDKLRAMSDADFAQVNFFLAENNA